MGPPGPPDFLTEPCTAVIVDVQEEGEHLACATHEGYLFDIPSDVVTPEWIAAKLETGELKSGESLLDIPKGITISRGVLSLVEPPGLVNDRRDRKLAVVEGTKSILAVRINVQDSSVTFNEDVLSNEVFGNGVDPVNLVERFDS